MVFPSPSTSTFNPCFFPDSEDTRGPQAALCMKRLGSEGFYAEIIGICVLFSVLSQELSKKVADSETGFTIRDLCLPRLYHNCCHCYYSISSCFLCYSWFYFTEFVFICSDCYRLELLRPFAIFLVDPLRLTQVQWMLFVKRMVKGKLFLYLCQRMLSARPL